MATISIADNDARVQYTQAVTANTTQLTIDFPFFDNDDINVIVTSAAGVDTTLTRGTGTGTFAVVGTSVDDGFSGGYVTLGDTYSDAATKYTIFRDISVARTTDFPTSGPFNVSSLNTELDKIFAIEQELETKIGRTMKLADSDTAATLSLPNLDTRKGTVLAFNTTTGLPEAGPEIGDISTIAAITTDIATLADIEDGTDATDAIQTVAGISANVTTVAGISSSVTTVAGQTTNMQNITDNLTAVQNAATNATNAAASATAAAASESAAATSETNAATSATNSATSATSSATSATASAASATAAAASESAAATSETNAATSASNASTSETNAATSASSASTSATNAATSASNASTSESNAASSATAAASSASAAATSQTAAAASAASAASAFDNFDDTYLGSKTADPTVDNDGDPLTQGDLYFNSTANEMRVYDGANWIAASSAGGASLILYEYTATSGQTTFSGADDNAATMSYTADNIQVFMNGVNLDPSDYTATNGTSVVLASGATTGDLVNIYAFKSFTVADTVSASAGGTFNGNVTFNANAIFGDNDKATFGDAAGGDMDIFHDGSNSVIRDRGQGDLKILGTNVQLKNADDTETYLDCTNNGGVRIFHDNSLTLNTTSTGIDVTGVATGDFNDNRQCVMGFMLTSGVSGDQNPITGWANMATQLSGDGAGQITRGGSITESSGVFSFPFTGLWQIEFFASLNSSGADGTIQYNIKSSTDGGSTYTTLIAAKESASSGSYKAFASTKALFNASNTSTHKIKFQQSSFSSHTSEGSTTEALTYAIFTWLGDAS